MHADCRKKAAPKAAFFYSCKGASAFTIANGILMPVNHSGIIIPR